MVIIPEFLCELKRFVGDHKMCENTAGISSHIARVNMEKPGRAMFFILFIVVLL